MKMSFHETKGEKNANIFQFLIVYHPAIVFTG